MVESSPHDPLPELLLRPFAVVVFDWDGTAVADRRADASALRERLLALAAAQAVTLVVVTGTHIGNVLGQLDLAAAPVPSRRLFIATNRGSEVFEVGPDGAATRIWRRVATPDEDARLDAAAAQVQATLQARTGLEVAVIADRMNRRKIDLIPGPAWHDPPKARIAELLAAVRERFARAGRPDGLAEALACAREAARAAGLPDARVTSDVKHVEIGLTDKGDTMAWVMAHLAPALGVPAEDLLVVGDEFGEVAGEPGSDALLMIPAAGRATFVSVGAEPGGVPPGVIGLPGGPVAFLHLLAWQAGLPRRPTPPAAFVPGLDPAWTLVEDGRLAGEHAVETRFAIANGRLGARSALAAGGPDARPATFAAGIFGAAPDGIQELVVAPDWRRVAITIDGERLDLAAGESLLHRRVLDLRRGVWHLVWRHRSPRGRVTRLHEVRWASLADRRLLVQAFWLVPENYGGAITLTAWLDARVGNLSGAAHLAPLAAGGVPWPHLAARVHGAGATLALAAASDLSGLAPPTTEVGPGHVAVHYTGAPPMGGACALVRKLALHSSRDAADPLAAALAHAARLDATALAALEADHARAWAARWAAADVEVDGDDAAQHALRFAAYHLIGATDPADAGASIAARGLTGEGYRGHVFWDTEVYLLPFYLHTEPAAARALLAYRHGTLPAARARARALGHAGALFAWESTDSGEDATPTRVVGPLGEVVPILTGLAEQHVSSAIAHAVWRYWQATADEAFMREAGVEILVEVARFWRSRAERGDDGRYHVRGVIGPDEYHVGVDDNAYTNVMAQWALERACEAVADLAGRQPDAWRVLADRLAWDPAEPAAWAEVADRLVTGLDPATGVFEQFAGYHALAAVEAATLVPSPAVALALDPALQARSQAIKQADAVMLLHLLWERFPDAVRRATFAYYEPRAVHGSSLSPATHGLVAARLGELELAQRYFRLAGAIDVDDRFGNTAAGIHMATQGGLWQLAVFGFGGAQVGDGALALTPALPPGWRRLAFPFACRGWRVRVAITPALIAVAVVEAGAAPLVVTLPGAGPRSLADGRLQASREGGGWRWDDPTDR